MASGQLALATPPFNSAAQSPLIFTAALLKVASRCNLDCDYCYVYKHADQSWRNQPKLMATATIDRFARRLSEYLDLHDLPEFSVTFHGGEPLLFGGERLTSAARTIREIAGPAHALSFSLQTNGTLLTDELIAQLESIPIDVSLSLDGPRDLHDRHRLDHAGRSTFDATLDAIHRLQRRKASIFTGVIAVIEPLIPPRELFEFFSPLRLPRLDLLLPDSTHDRPPPGRDESPSLYVRWLQEAFDLWFNEFSHIPIRWFDSLLASRLGVPCATDAMGLGSVNLLVVDTDGSYTDHDVFKITFDGRTSLGHNVERTSFDEISKHPIIREHAFRLTLPGLPEACQRCPVVEACGGGSVMHRWHPHHGLNAPSVFCPELFGVIETATQAISQSLNHRATTSFAPFIALPDNSRLLEECIRWRSETESRANATAERLGFPRKQDSAAAIILSDSFDLPLSCSEAMTAREPSLWLGAIKLQSDDPRLVAPFLGSIRLLPPQSAQVKYALSILPSVRTLLSQVNRALPNAFAALVSDILFVESTIESQDHIFSFSDDSAPNVLYIAAFAGGTPISPDDLADSMLHEFLHHILYHSEHDGAMLHDHLYPRFPAPWRTGLRPAGGFFHGTFVFSGLSLYWRAIARSGLPGLNVAKAIENCTRFARQAEYGIKALRQFALLTPRGQALLDQLATSLCLGNEPLAAPSLQVYSTRHGKKAC